jgi:hypothetical protein
LNIHLLAGEVSNSGGKPTVLTLEVNMLEYSLVSWRAVRRAGASPPSLPLRLITLNIHLLAGELFDERGQAHLPYPEVNNLDYSLVSWRAFPTAGG